MGDVEVAGIGFAPELGRELIAVSLREGARHDRRDLRVLPQPEDLLAQLRIGHRERAVGFRADGARVIAEPVLRPFRLHEPEPGLLDELEEPGRRRASGPRLRVEGRFLLRGRKQVVETDAGPLGSLPDGVHDRIGRRRVTSGRRGEQEHRVLGAAARERAARKLPLRLASLW
jgi:hypothetical protein